MIVRLTELETVSLGQVVRLTELETASQIIGCQNLGDSELNNWLSDSPSQRHRAKGLVVRLMEMEIAS